MKTAALRPRLCNRWVAIAPRRCRLGNDLGVDRPEAIPIAPGGFQFAAVEIPERRVLSHRRGLPSERGVPVLVRSRRRDHVFAGGPFLRRLSYATAKRIVERFEYLRSMPRFVRHCYGLYFGDELAGVVVYAAEPAENLGAWDRYGFTGKVILLARGVCLPWAHPHSASRLIRQSMRLLPERYRVVTATVDPSGG
jgi:hypothetical protein